MMDGMEIYNALERIRKLERELKSEKLDFGNEKFAEYNELVKGIRLVSFNELRDYHNFAMKDIIGERSRKDELVEKLKDIGAPESREIIYSIIRDVYG